MDEATVDAAGLTPLAPLLAEIHGARSSDDVQRVIRRLHELAIPVPFAVTGAYDYQVPENTVANIAAGGLGLPNRDHYLNPEPRLAAVREAYRAHVATVLTLGGMPEARPARPPTRSSRSRRASPRRPWIPRPPPIRPRPRTS